MIVNVDDEMSLLYCGNVNTHFFTLHFGMHDVRNLQVFVADEKMCAYACVCVCDCVLKSNIKIFLVRDSSQIRSYGIQKYLLP